MRALLPVVQVRSTALDQSVRLCLHRPVSAQVHATLALADILRDVVAELGAIRQAVQR
jgi:hypothetical protein